MNETDFGELLGRIQPSDVIEWNERTTRTRAVEPMIELLDWPLRTPLEGVNVSVDEDFQEDTVDYVVYTNGQMRIMMDVLPEIEDADLHKPCIRETNWYIVTDGYDYQINVSTEEGLTKVKDFNLNSFSEDENLIDVLGFKGLDTGLTRKVHDKYHQLEKDRAKLESEAEDRIAQSLSREFQVLNTEEIHEGSERMADFLLRKLEGKEFDDIVRQVREVDDMSLEVKDDKLVIIVKDSVESIEEHFRKENPTGRIVTYSEERPYYIAFYTEEKNQIDHIARIASFDLVKNREQKEFADKVFDIEIENIRELEQPIADNSDSMMPIEYCQSDQILNSGTADEIELLDY